MPRYRVTVDTGGTFSDFVYLDEATGAVSIAKVASTPDDPSRAIIQGVEGLLAQGVAAQDIAFFCHGTTVGTNALLEGKGASTGLLVTEGFRGIYPVGEQSRPYGSAIFDVMFDKPAMLVTQSRTGEVKERVDFRGSVLRPLDEPALRGSVRALKAQGVESIAVCLLFAFLHPAHEARVREIIAEEMPGCSVSLSSEVLPQIREYFRLSTTVINAYLQPILARYIGELDARLQGARVTTRQKYIMQSNGGTATFAAAARKAVTTVLSGPAGGVTAGVAASRMTGFPNVITFDMGGTSCDVALIRDGAPSVASRGKIEGRDIAVPMMDINTVSAGGGTIARVDRFGTLQVGPDSAGAAPGPACYGRGGKAPTITDCNLLLGFLSPDNFLGGRMRLDADAARAAVESVARPLALDPAAAADGIVRIIEVKMAEAIKAISTMRGHDLREFMLLAFGGAGPVHAARIARDLGMAGVIVPLYPGVFSAIGLMMSDVKHDYVQSRMDPIAALAPADVDAMFARLTEQADADLRADGFAEAQIGIERAVDMRYAGQGYEITIPCDAAATEDLARLRARFDAQHAVMFGHNAPEEPVEIVSYRVRGIGKVPPVEMPRFARTGTRLAAAERARRPVRFDGETIDCPVYRREMLDVGLTVLGPAVLDQLDCTTVICPGQVARVDDWKNLIVTEAG
ncbi:MAG TPA: hydantoinase/oxoprolinase family protein [Xanthobacteraceae bacterium]|nr:hydantoinase/oxoprolinase family protein [Xanthobacteraceae bacterium]